MLGSDDRERSRSEIALFSSGGEGMGPNIFFMPLKALVSLTPGLDSLRWALIWYGMVLIWYGINMVWYGMVEYCCC